MNLHDPQRFALLWQDLLMVGPEVFLILAMCGVIITPFIRRTATALHTAVALGGLALALVATLLYIGDASRFVFHGSLSIDTFSQFFKIILIVFTALVVGQWWLLDRQDTDPRDVPDLLCLILGATVGMSLMASAANLLVIVIAIETASLPSYALAGFRKKKRISTEASMKYVVFGSAASAIMIYGMSLVYGICGTLDLAAVAQAAAGGMTPMLALGLLGMLAGVAFKLSAVPLHFWCPDVFEGAPITITTFLSVASKGGAICLFTRILYAFGAAAPAADTFAGLAVGAGILGIVTATWGNLAALKQENLKRMLAYSSIAHAGYMIMAASSMAVAGRSGAAQADDVGLAILFYVLVYSFMNLGAFTVVGLIANRTGSEDLRQFAGLPKRAPMLAGLLLVFLLSLFGMPGLGGFLGKIVLMKAFAGPMQWLMMAVLLTNTVISLYYYVGRPVFVMFWEKREGETEAAAAARVPVFSGAVLALLIACAAVLFATGLGIGTSTIEDYATLNVGRPDVATAASAPTLHDAPDAAEALPVAQAIAAPPQM